MADVARKGWARLFHFFRERMNDHYLLTVVAGPMVLLGLVFGIWAWQVDDGGLQGALVEGAATCLGVLLTVFYVEAVRDQHEEQRWSRLTTIIQRRVKRTALLRTTKIIELQENYSYFNSRGAYYQAQQEEIVLDEAWIEVVQATADDIPKYLKPLTPVLWTSLAQALDKMATEYFLTASQTVERLEPDTYALLWRTQELAEEAARIITMWDQEDMPSIYATVNVDLGVAMGSNEYMQRLERILAEVLRNNLTLLMD